MAEPRRVPSLRIRSANDAPPRDDRAFVLYWMIATRRCDHNFGLQRAARVAHHLGKPLVVVEALRTSYRWASDRLHRFVMQGMAENVRRLRGTPVLHHPFLERRPGEGKGLLRALGAHACLVVTDDFPTFFLPRMVEAAAAQLDVRLEAVDSNGLLPMRTADRTFARAHDFRRFLHKHLPLHLAPDAWPTPEPLEGLELPSLEVLPGGVNERWPAVSLEALEDPGTLDELPIDHAVRPAPLTGGSAAAEARWAAFRAEKLDSYAEGRNHPDEDASSGLSPWLHFGHISPHRILADLAADEGWSTDRLGSPSGKRQGWWNLGEGKEAFLDELVTWREVGFNMAHRVPDHCAWTSLPEWAQKTLAEHKRDPRPYEYDLATFEAAETHDELWNAAQRQLVGEGRIHNYLRMLWGKKILHWSETPELALDTMIELNNKYALDGRDPNSYSGIFWVLGRYDRPWGPERGVFGKIRYMTSDSTRRKLRVGKYLERWSATRLPLGG